MKWKRKNPWAPHLGNNPSQDSSRTLSFPNLMMKLLGKKQLSCSQWILSWIEDVISKFQSNNAKQSWAKVDWLHSVVWCIETSNCTSWDVMLITSIFWWAWSDQSYPKKLSHVLNHLQLVQMTSSSKATQALRCVIAFFRWHHAVIGDLPTAQCCWQFSQH